MFATLLGLALFTLIGVGARLLVMTTVQQRRERMNRQINERLRTLIAAYKVLGGSFTGNLSVNPAHLRDLRSSADAVIDDDTHATSMPDPSAGNPGSERGRRIRDAVEAALSDIMLLGTESQVRLAERAARDLVEGRSIHTHDLVVSLRNYIREALDLDPVPAELQIPMQGPTRPPGSGARGKGEGNKGETPKGNAGRAGMAGGGAAGFGPDSSDVASPPDHDR
ncbi:hypothetical protein BH09PSE6_BH09PSE6_17210 [soil metagenome]